MTKGLPHNITDEMWVLHWTRTIVPTPLPTHSKAVRRNVTFIKLRFIFRLTFIHFSCTKRIKGERFFFLFLLYRSRIWYCCYDFYFFLSVAVYVFCIVVIYPRGKGRYVLKIVYLYLVFDMLCLCMPRVCIFEGNGQVELTLF